MLLERFLLLTFWTTMTDIKIICSHEMAREAVALTVNDTQKNLLIYNKG